MACWVTPSSTSGPVLGLPGPVLESDRLKVTFCPREDEVVLAEISRATLGFDPSTVV